MKTETVIRMQDGPAYIKLETAEGSTLTFELNHMTKELYKVPLDKLKVRGVTLMAPFGRDGYMCVSALFKTTRKVSNA